MEYDNHIMRKDSGLVKTEKAFENMAKTMVVGEELSGRAVKMTAEAARDDEV